MNYYVAGKIQNQKNGLGGIGGADNGHKFNDNVDVNVLTSVEFIDNGGNGGPQNNGFYGLDGTHNYSYSSSTSALLLFSQKGQNAQGAEAPIDANVGPKGLTVTLTLVPATQSTPSVPANK